MSLKTRLGLVASSSLAAAVSLIVLTPEKAVAQSCTPTAGTVTASGPAADTVTCTAGTYASGITYNSNGDLSVSMVANGAVVNSPMTNNGVTLTGTGADSITFNSAVGGVSGAAGTNGPIIDVTTAAGSISITTGSITTAAASATHGIRATSMAGGNILITRSAGAVSTTVAGAVAAIEATTTGGNINITTAGANTQGRLRGILAQTSGTGAISITSNSLVSASAIDGAGAIDTVAGTGTTTIAINAGSVNGGTGLAIRSVSSGAVNIQHSVSGNTDVTGAVNFASVTGGVTWNGGLQGRWVSTGASSFSGGADALTLTSGSVVGSIDFGSGADTFNIAAISNGQVFDATDSVISFGAGADRLNVTGALEATDTAINFGADADVLSVAGRVTLAGATLDFGSGADDLDQQGIFAADGVATVNNLEAFDNTGSIFLGGGFSSASDGTIDDVLRVTSGVFTGSDDSLIVMAAFLGTHASQVGCATLVAADCMDFTGASTAGSTRVRVLDASFSVDGGTLDSIVTLIQGSKAAEHFTLDPASSYYTQTAQGPAIRKPVVAYYFRYDAANQRHVLVGAPADEPFQVATFSASAQEVWRATSGSWLTRQADLRATPGGLEASRGVWGRVSAQSGEREAGASYSTGGVSLDYDLSQKQRIAHLNLGADVIGGPGWVAGATVGFVRSDVEFEATPTEATMTGFSGGLYASYVAGPLFVDGLLNANILHIKADAPAMGLGLDVPMKFDLKSLGGQLEAGWRFGMESFFVEPLAGVSYVVTRIEDTEVPGGSGLFDFEESKSLRLGAGARVGLDSELAGMVASYSLTGRYWNESEGEGSATITTASGSSAVLPDAFTGDFSDVAASLGLYGSGGGVSGFVTLGGKFGDGYQAVDGSAGVRVRW